MVCLRNIRIKTLHKGYNDDNNNRSNWKLTISSIAAITNLKLAGNCNCLLFLRNAFQCLPGVEYRRWYVEFNSMTKSQNQAQDDPRRMAKLSHHWYLRFLSTKIFVILSVRIWKSFLINLD